MRKKLSYGHTPNWGHTMTDEQVNEYNKIQDELDDWFEHGYPYPDFLLSKSRKLYRLATGTNED